jgi:hypothetical protein
MKLFILLIFPLICPGTLGLTCYYSRSANTVRCGSVQCSAVSPWLSSWKLPPGSYRVGGDPWWFKLYPARKSGGYWDYHTKSADHSCRGGFALHPGGISEGCITVVDDSCYDRLKGVITGQGTSSVTVRECLRCWWGSCRGGEQNIKRTLYNSVWVHSY